MSERNPEQEAADALALQRVESARRAAEAAEAARQQAAVLRGEVR
ncbi:hypothetical protein [Streptomyces noursei]|nr:hypothetical protein [Streptomyces noursei]